MASKTKATAVKISEKDARGYSYVRNSRRFRPNGGVTAVVAINGPGAYEAAKSARAVTEGKRPSVARRLAKGALTVAMLQPGMIGVQLAGKATGKIFNKAISRREPMLNKNPRRHSAPTAKQLKARAAFAKKAKAGLFRRNPVSRTVSMPRTTRPLRTQPMNLQEIREATRASGYRRNPISASQRRTVVAGGALPRFELPGERSGVRARSISSMRTVKRPQPVASRRAKNLANLAKGRAKRAANLRLMKRLNEADKAVKLPRRNKSRKSPSAIKRTAQEKLVMKKRRKKATSAASVVAKKRSRKVGKKTKRSGRKVSRRKLSSAQLIALAKGRAKRAGKASKRKTTKRKASTVKVARKVRKSSGGKVARKVRRRKSKSVKSAAPRKARRTAAQKAASKRNIKKARSSVKGVRKTKKSAKSKMRKNGRHTRKGFGSMRRNDTPEMFVTALKVGALATAGFVAHKLGTALINSFLVDKLSTAAVQTAAETSPAAAAGLGALQPFVSGLIGGGGTMLAELFLINKFVESPDQKRLLAAGVVTSFLHTLIVTAAERVAPQAAPMLAGGEASRMSAMYGIDSQSLMPRYAAIGEYFSGQSGLGEYFSGQSGLGEYFSGQSGLGDYGTNPDIYEASAGYGALEAPSNHIDPSSDLDRELSIAEAAAGVGDIYQASAGMGNIYEASAGMGALGPISSVSTNIPGGELWASVRGIGAGSSATEPAGTLSTAGGSGIFG